MDNGIFISFCFIFILLYYGWKLYDKYVIQKNISNSLAIYSKKNKRKFKLNDTNNEIFCFPFPDTFQDRYEYEIKNIVIKEDINCNIYWGDFNYYIHHYKRGKEVYRKSFIIFECPDIYIPDFYIKDNVFTFEEIGVETNKKKISLFQDNDFSSSFVLKGFEEDKLEKLFNPALRKNILSLKGLGYTIEAANHSFIISYLLPKQLKNIEDRLKLEILGIRIFKQIKDNLKNIE